MKKLELLKICKIALVLENDEYDLELDIGEDILNEVQQCWNKHKMDKGRFKIVYLERVNIDNTKQFFKIDRNETLKQPIDMGLKIVLLVSAENEKAEAYTLQIRNVAFQNLQNYRFQGDRLIIENVELIKKYGFLMKLEKMEDADIL